MKTALLVVVATPAIVAAHVACRSPGAVLALAGDGGPLRCYDVAATDVGWDACRDLCDADGATMLCIRTYLENKLLYDTFYGAIGPYWAGYSDANPANGTFAWESPACESTYSAWRAGQPDRYAAEGKAGFTLVGNDFGLAWSDVWFGRPSACICEAEPIAVTPAPTSSPTTSKPPTSSPTVECPVCASSCSPSVAPSAAPSLEPSAAPTMTPSGAPSFVPTTTPEALTLDVTFTNLSTIAPLTEWGPDGKGGIIGTPVFGPNNGKDAVTIAPGPYGGGARVRNLLLQDASPYLSTDSGCITVEFLMDGDLVPFQSGIFRIFDGPFGAAGAGTAGGVAIWLSNEFSSSLEPGADAFYFRGWLAGQISALPGIVLPITLFEKHAWHTVSATWDRLDDPASWVKLNLYVNGSHIDPSLYPWRANATHLGSDVGHLPAEDMHFQWIDVAGTNDEAGNDFFLHRLQLYNSSAPCTSS